MKELMKFKHIPEGVCPLKTGSYEASVFITNDVFSDEIGDLVGNNPITGHLTALGWGGTLKMWDYGQPQEVDIYDINEEALIAAHASLPILVQAESFEDFCRHLLNETEARYKWSASVLADQNPHFFKDPNIQQAISITHEAMTSHLMGVVPMSYGFDHLSKNYNKIRTTALQNKININLGDVFTQQVQDQIRAKQLANPGVHGLYVTDAPFIVPDKAHTLYNIAQNTWVFSTKTPYNEENPVTEVVTMFNDLPFNYYSI